MKILAVSNGWIVAPHCWRTFLRRPFRVERTPRWTCVTVLGVAVFFAAGGVGR